LRYLSLEVVFELDEAIQSYELQRPGRGHRFEAEVQATYRRIDDSPLAFPRFPFIVRPIVRRARVTRFPYSVLYYLLRGEPIVVAIAHGRRAPSAWRERLR
jgi:toxin ParE2